MLTKKYGDSADGWVVVFTSGPASVSSDQLPSMITSLLGLLCLTYGFAIFCKAYFLADDVSRANSQLRKSVPTLKRRVRRKFARRLALARNDPVSLARVEIELAEALKHSQ